MKHLKAEELSALLDGALPADRREAAGRHLAVCAACREELATLTEQDALLARTLAHDPGDAYFERFADRVADRIRPAAAPSPWWDRLLSPRGFALAGSVAAVVAVAGLVWMQSRESGTTALRNPVIDRYGSQASPPAPATEAAPGAVPAPRPAVDADETGAAAGSSMAAAENERKSKEETAGARVNAAARPGSVAGSLAPSAPSGRTEARERRATGAADEARMLEVRRAPDGEDVVIEKGALPGPADAAPHATSAPAPSGAGITVRKQRPRATSDAPQEPVLPVQELTQREDGVAKHLRGARAPGEPGTPGAVRVCGTVVDGSGRPVAGANITVVESRKGAVTGADGRYCVETPPGTSTFSVLSIGFGAVRREVEVAAAAEPVDFRLESVNVLPQALDAGASRAKRAPATGLQTFAPAPWPPAARPLADRADSLTHLAESGSGAERFEAAATAWSGVAAAARGHAAEPRALARVAEMRHRAWKATPTDVRRLAALAAARAYLEAAPRAPASDPARGWLRELSR